VKTIIALGNLLRCQVYWLTVLAYGHHYVSVYAFVTDSDCVDD